MLLSMVLYMMGWGLHSMILRLQPSRPFNAFQPRALSMIEVGLIADGSNVNLYETERSMGREAHNKGTALFTSCWSPKPWSFLGSWCFQAVHDLECSHMQFKHCGSVTKPSGLPYFKSALASLFYAVSKFSGNYSPRWSNITCTLYYFVTTDAHLDLFRFFPQTQTTLNILGNHYASQDLKLMKMWAIWRDGKHIYCLPAAVALSQTPSLDIYPGRIHSSAFSSHI